MPTTDTQSPPTEQTDIDELTKAIAAQLAQAQIAGRLQAEHQLAQAQIAGRLQAEHIQLERVRVKIKQEILRCHAARQEQMLALVENIGGVADSQLEIIALLGKLPDYADDMRHLMTLILSALQQIGVYLAAHNGGDANAGAVQRRITAALEADTLDSYQRQLHSTIARLNLARERIAKKGGDADLSLEGEVRELERRLEEIQEEIKRLGE